MTKLLRVLGLIAGVFSCSTIGVADTINGHGYTLVASSVHSGGGPVQANVSSGFVENGNGQNLASAVTDPVFTGSGENGHGMTVVVGPAVLIAQLAESIPSGVTGDVNNDGVVSPADAQAVFQCYLMGGCATPAKTAAADLCAGGPVAVTPTDAQAVFNLFLGLGTGCD